MDALSQLRENNQRWAAAMTAEDTHFFQRLAQQQAPAYLWIGCSDSRVPATQLTNLDPGEMFVHRNIANVVIHTDLNCLSVLHFAVEVLKVQHIIVCGHYGCGGVEAALHKRRFGLIDNWLRHIEDVRDKHSDLLQACADDQARLDRLCELNVVEQVVNVCRTSLVQDGWQRGQSLAVHGWIYGLSDGLIRDVSASITAPAEIETVYAQAIQR